MGDHRKEMPRSPKAIDAEVVTGGDLGLAPLAAASSGEKVKNLGS